MTDSLWAELEAIEARDATRHDCRDFLGGCPICGRTDVCLNVGREHWVGQRFREESAPRVDAIVPEVLGGVTG